MAERTLIIVKPDGVQRRLVGEIVSRLERKGFKLVAAKFMRVPEELARRHYAVHADKPFYEPLVAYLCSAPVLVMVWEGQHVIAAARKLIGRTFGAEAKPGTIRGDFGCSLRYNLVHGSDSAESAEREIGLFFEPAEIVEYEMMDSVWISGEEVSSG